MPQPVSIDLDDIINAFAAENASATRRAIIAEAASSARDKIIEQLQARIDELTAQLEPNVEDVDETAIEEAAARAV